MQKQPNTPPPAYKAPFRLTAPDPFERDIHEACADALDRMLLRPAEWACYPAGGTQLSPQQHSRYSRMGLKRGWPDLMISYDGMYGIELKRPGGRLSKTVVGRTSRGGPRVLIGQEEMFLRLIASGWKGIAVCHSVDEVLDQIEQWEIPCRRRVRQCPG